MFYNKNMLYCRHITLQDDDKGIVKEHIKVYKNGKYEVLERV